MKIDTYQCVFRAEALSFKQIEDQYYAFQNRMPTQMIVHTALDAVAGFSSKLENCVALGPDDFRKMVTGPYCLRNNDVIFTAGSGAQQNLIVSCCGEKEI